MFTETINGVQLIFETAEDSFSPLYVDKGTLAMLSTVNFSKTDKVLDLGCGYGAVGVYAAKQIGDKSVMMSDIDEKSVKLSRKNAELNGVSGVQVVISDGFRNISEKDFSIILSNPPYHSDFSIAKHFIEKGFNRLCIGGKMVLVTKRKDWYKNKLITIFGGININEIDGYFMFCSEKRNYKYANVLC